MPGPSQTPSVQTVLADLTTLIARIAIGAVFVAHGWQKIADGIGGTAAGTMQPAGVPLPEVAAVVAIVIEFGGGIALILGFALPLVGVVLAAQMVAAISFVHLGMPFIGAEGAMELPLGLGAAALALGFTGGGYALDRFLPWGHRRPAAAGVTTRPVERSS